MAINQFSPISIFILSQLTNYHLVTDQHIVWILLSFKHKKDSKAVSQTIFTFFLYLLLFNQGVAAPLGDNDFLDVVLGFTPLIATFFLVLFVAFAGGY